MLRCRSCWAFRADSWQRYRRHNSKNSQIQQQPLQQVKHPQGQQQQQQQRRPNLFMATDSRELRRGYATTVSAASSKSNRYHSHDHNSLDHPLLVQAVRAALFQNNSDGISAWKRQFYENANNDDWYSTFTRTATLAMKVSTSTVADLSTVTAAAATTTTDASPSAAHSTITVSTSVRSKVDPIAHTAAASSGMRANESTTGTRAGVRYFRRTFASMSRDGNEHDEKKQKADSTTSSTSTASSEPMAAIVANHNLLARPPKEGYGHFIRLTDEEKRLFNLLRQVRSETHLSTTLRVAGGWVRDKLLATDEFRVYHTVFDVGAERQRLTSKFRKPAPSMGRQGTKVLVNSAADALESCQPVDIDIALDDMLGREFADHLNDYLSSQGEDTVSVGVVLKNPEKSKHLETATMKVGPFWIDFVNLRAEEYTQDSRIPELMRIGTAAEDAYRRDLTINSLFYNVNTGQVEDWTGRGFDDLRKGVVATPLPPLTTLLDDPLRVLRSIRFAARLRFTMDQELIDAATDRRVRDALALKVSRERVGGEVDLMLRSPDPVGAVRLLINLELAGTVFPIQKYLGEGGESASTFFTNGLTLLSICHDHLADCRLSPPLWCLKKDSIYAGTVETRLTEDEETRRLLWYASFLKPFHDFNKLESTRKAPKREGKKGNRSAVVKLLVDDLKRPIRDAEAVERIMKGADEFTQLLSSGCDISATMILLSDVLVASDYSIVNGCYSSEQSIICSMNNRIVDSVKEEDPLWEHAMEFRLLCSHVLQRLGPLWRAGLMLALAEQLGSLEDNLEYAIEGDTFEESKEEKRQGIIERFDVFATALQRIGLIGVWNEKPLLDGDEIRNLLPKIPKGPAFRDVMDEQIRWMIAHPGSNKGALSVHLQQIFTEFC